MFSLSHLSTIRQWLWKYAIHRNQSFLYVIEIKIILVIFIESIDWTYCKFLNLLAFSRIFHIHFQVSFSYLPSSFMFNFQKKISKKHFFTNFILLRYKLFISIDIHQGPQLVRASTIIFASSLSKQWKNFQQKNVMDYCCSMKLEPVRTFNCTQKQKKIPGARLHVLASGKYP